MKSALREFKGHKKFLLLVLLELIFAVLVAVSFLNLFGFNIFEAFSCGKNFFSFSNNLFDIVFFVASLAVLLAIFAAIRSVPELYRAQKLAFSEIRKAAKMKFGSAKYDPRVSALLLIEFIFAVAVFVSVSAFLDPAVELIPWSKTGIKPPETTIINACIALLVLYCFYWIYSQTASFRIERKAKKKK